MEKHCLSNQQVYRSHRCLRYSTIQDYVICRKSTQSTINAYYDDRPPIIFPKIRVLEDDFEVPLQYFEHSVYLNRIRVDSVFLIRYDLNQFHIKGVQATGSSNDEGKEEKVENEVIKVKTEEVKVSKKESAANEVTKEEKKTKKEPNEVKEERIEKKKAKAAVSEVKKEEKKPSKVQSIKRKEKDTTESKRKKQIEIKSTTQESNPPSPSKPVHHYTENQIRKFIQSFNLNNSLESFSNRNQNKHVYHFIKGFLNEDEQLDDDYICRQMMNYYDYQKKTDSEKDQEKRHLKKNSQSVENDGIVRDKYTAMNEFELIDENIYVHRQRKHENELSAYKCGCIPKSDPVPCGENCINRQLFYECNPKHCLNGNKCTNCQFRKRQYQPVYFKLFPHKGWGLLAANDIKPNTFIGEYVGEVIHASDLEERIDKRNNKHVYLMALGKGELIDATSKGGIFRYINHSCDPNCETQKWTVDGESCIGIFSKKFIKRGEELTFDYQFERYTDENNTCYCGSKNCRGVIGEKRDPFIDINTDRAFDVGLMDSTYRCFDKRVCNRVRYQVSEHLDDITSILYFRYLNKKNREFRRKHPRHIYLHRNNLFLNRNIHNRYRYYTYIEKNDIYRDTQNIFGIIDSKFKRDYKDNIYRFV